MGKPAPVVLALLITGCTPAVWQGVANGLAGAQPAVASATKLMVFGGQGHGTYLGCLSCSTYDLESVLNALGAHGSTYGAESILNPYSEFGSPYSAYSACNPYATDPPVIVDQLGNYYGRLTINQARTDGPPTSELKAWIQGVCAR